MQRALDQLFKDAVNRKPKRLSFDTTYSHGNIYDWLKTILTDWTIIIPGSSCSEFALSNWPATGFTRNGVKQWLEEKNHQKPDDLIDGASVLLGILFLLAFSVAAIVFFWLPLTSLNAIYNCTVYHYIFMISSASLKL